jgi:hypothetical protein
MMWQGDYNESRDIVSHLVKPAGTAALQYLFHTIGRDHPRESATL